MFKKGSQSVHREVRPANGSVWGGPWTGAQLENKAFGDIETCQLLRHLWIHKNTKHLVIDGAQFIWKQTVWRSWSLSVVETPLDLFGRQCISWSALLDSFQNNSFGDHLESSDWLTNNIVSSVCLHPNAQIASTHESIPVPLQIVSHWASDRQC